MGRIIDNQEFSRKGKEGIKFTVKQRAPTARAAELAVVPQMVARFPVKAGQTEILGSRQVGNVAGPISVYEVDIFVPIKDVGSVPTQSGDISDQGMT